VGPGHAAGHDTVLLLFLYDRSRQTAETSFPTNDFPPPVAISSERPGIGGGGAHQAVVVTDVAARNEYWVIQ